MLPSVPINPLNIPLVWQLIYFFHSFPLSLILEFSLFLLKTKTVFPQFVCPSHLRQPITAMVTVSSSEHQKKEELRASETLGIPCSEEETDGTLWSGNDEDYKPFPKKTQEITLPPSSHNDRVRESIKPGQIRPSMMDPFETAVVAMRNSQVEIQNGGETSERPPNQDTDQNPRNETA